MSLFEFGGNIDSTLKGWTTNFKIQAAMATWARKWGPSLRDAISAEAPVKTGRLRDSIRFTTSYTLRGSVIKIWSNAPYSQYVQSGTAGGQTIAPVVMQALHWVGASGDVFATQVTRGKTSANDFVHQGFGKLQKRMSDSLMEMVAEAGVGKTP